MTVAPIAKSLGPDSDGVLDVALEALRFEHAHAEASRSRAALERLAAARAANLVSRSRSIRAMALYVSALGVLGARVLLIALVHLVGI